MNLLKLQNGSDIRGVALPLDSKQEVNLTEREVSYLAKGFRVLLENRLKKDDLVIAVGGDSRLSTPALKNAVCETLKKTGCKVLDCGLASTPAMFMACQFGEIDADGAIMLTASHLPSNRNGMKFFTKTGGFGKKDILKMIKLAILNVERNWPAGSIEKCDLIARYSEHLQTMIKEQVQAADYASPLKGLKIVVDAGNGAAGFYAKNILEPLGADISGSQFLEPDGNFPNHIPNPEDKVAIKAICDAVKANGADLGLIFDTDVDRSSAVDSYGKAINRDALIALATALVAKEHPHTYIVTDSVTSDELTKFIEEDMQCKHLRFKRGYKNVIDKAIELNNQGIDAQLAIETSGHGAFKENYFLDDGAYLATKIVIACANLKKEGKEIGDLIKTLEYPAEEVELRFDIKCEDHLNCGLFALEEFKRYFENHPDYVVNQENYEGIRINGIKDNNLGFALLRPSLHDPLLALNIASKNHGGCKKIANDVYNALINQDQLNLEPLVMYLR